MELVSRGEIEGVVGIFPGVHQPLRRSGDVAGDAAKGDFDALGQARDALAILFRSAGFMRRGDQERQVAARLQGHGRPHVHARVSHGHVEALRRTILKREFDAPRGIYEARSVLLVHSGPRS